jgi:hypothetical protein
MSIYCDWQILPFFTYIKYFLENDGGDHSPPLITITQHKGLAAGSLQQGREGGWGSDTSQTYL